MDWKTRFKNKAFIISLISALLVFLELVLQPFGIKINNNYIMTIVNALLGVLTILGVVVDPSTPGISDTLKRANMPMWHYKLKPSEPDERDFKFFHSVNPVLSVDLRPNMPPIDDQGNLGSCTANALVGIMGFLMINAKAPFVKLSRLYAYYKERVLTNTVNEDSGSSIRNECKVAASGICEEKYMPYDISKFTNTPSSEADQNATHKINQYKSVSSLEDIKKALTIGYPVAIGIEVYESFESKTTAETGKVKLPKKSEKMLGGHALVIVGYNDKKKVFIVRNSWGESWGDKGYCYMPYTYIKYIFDCWVMQ